MWFVAHARVLRFFPVLCAQRQPVQILVSTHQVPLASCCPLRLGKCTPRFRQWGVSPLVFQGLYTKSDDVCIGSAFDSMRLCSSPFAFSHDCNMSVTSCLSLLSVTWRVPSCVSGLCAFVCCINLLNCLIVVFLASLVTVSRPIFTILCLAYIYNKPNFDKEIRCRYPLKWVFDCAVFCNVLYMFTMFLRQPYCSRV